MMNAQLTERERECIEHALGLNRNRVSYRNYFMAEPQSPDDEVFVGLAARGLARLQRGPRPDFSPDNLWCITDSGCLAAGAQPPRRACA